ncbi:MAG: excinuclease ABC subunit UvrC [Planctomycetota bacterium]|nr:excinuclease ABC subunit C [Planctomycetota bacterium]MBL06198.1 excinuclease ABC subunit C [Planctomycetota bacterium]MEE3054822.1 excinuclease ABC subunit UvrC [Planctomycetota bacterium]|tara:strand:- start:3384 stop:5222 length:1839 start_codon:yes stop_codon:yes gene_type:complete
MASATKRKPSLKDKVSRLPTSPGVYIMKDSRSRILYIGKAVNLRSRVRSYFGKSNDGRLFIRLLMERIDDLDCILTETEDEALILENNLIKKHRPLYNVRLKDDKTYVSIKVTLSEEWPRVMVTRRYKAGEDLYFGPYGSSTAVREMLRVIKTVFPLRTCTNGFFRNRTRACLEYEIGRCTAPCVDLISKKDYMEDVSQVVMLLKGKSRELERIIEKRMKAASGNRLYELAARYRDQLAAIGKVFETQKVEEFRLGDIDAFSIIREGNFVAIQEVLVREGKIISSRTHSFRTELRRAEVLSSFLTQCYLTDRYIPPEVLCDSDFRDRDLLESWLSEKRGRRSRITLPQRGDKAAIIRLANRNAHNSFRIERDEQERMETLLESIEKHLELPNPPRRIECYDISNFQGSLAVGSMVSFEDGKPVRDRYRKYRIQTVVGADDFRCMKEVLERRLERGIKDGDLPDLVLVDGGKGQLSSAMKALKKIGLSSLPVAALAKERRRRQTTERIFLPGRKNPIALAQDTPESLYLQRIRDEAHRFAIRYHRELRRRDAMKTGLEDIPGIGKKRQQALLDRFRTLEKIRGASTEELSEVIGDKLALDLQSTLKQRPTRKK